jgi:hypothetical protein
LTITMSSFPSILLYCRLEPCESRSNCHYWQCHRHPTSGVSKVISRSLYKIQIINT